jgi:hypothetical protein
VLFATVASPASIDPLHRVLHQRLDRQPRQDEARQDKIKPDFMVLRFLALLAPITRHSLF